MKLLIKLLRDMKQSVGQMIAFVLIIAVGAFFYAGLITYSDHLSAYTKDYFHKHHLSDLNVSYSQLSRKDVKGLSQINGIHKIEGRYTFDARQTFGNVTASLKVHSIPENNEINIPEVLKGRMPLKKNEILLDSHYAHEHHLHSGDFTYIQANGRNLMFRISGLGEDVEHAKLNETQNHQTHGFAYLPETAIPEVAGSFIYNDLMIDAGKGADINKLGQSIERQSKQRQLPYLKQEKKERTFSYSQITETIENNKLMSRVIPFVLFVIEAMILFLSMSRMIDSERHQVGIMKALGVKNKKIMLHYMGYPVLVSIIGSILGCVTAELVFIPLVRESSARAYSLPDITFSLSYFSIIPPVLFSSAFGILACYLSGRSILKERAAQAMRPKPLKKMKTLWIERIPGFWGLLPYSSKLIVRNILFNKQKALASSIGVVASTVLLITAFGTETSLIKVANQTEKVYSYDLRVDYSEGTTLDSIKLPEGLKHHYDLSRSPVQLIKGDMKQKATLVATTKENHLIHFFDTKGQRISLGNDGVLIPQSYADNYHISVGDTIQMRFTAPELQNKTADMKVSAISAQYSDPSFYCTPAYLKSLGLDDNPTSVMLQVGHSTDLSRVRHFFEQDQQVDQITDQKDLKKSAQYIMKQNTFVFVMFIICSVILSFGAIFTISSINIYERMRELATLKVLGYSKSKINRLIFFENMILTVFAVIVALPISSYVFSLIVGALSSPHQQIPDQLKGVVLLASIVIAFLLTMLSNLLLRRKVSKINMIESLKSIE